MNFINWNTTGNTYLSDAGGSGYFESDEGVTLLTPAVSETITGVLQTSNTSFKEPNYQYLAQVHSELIEAGKPSEEIALWTGEALNISAWKEGKFHGKRGALPTPDTLEERQRFKKFIEALGVTYETNKGIEYDNANGPSENQPQYFLLDGFVQNAWFGEKNMREVDKKLLEINSYCQSYGVNNNARIQYVHKQIGDNLDKNPVSINIGYRSPLKSSGCDEGISIGGSFYQEEDGTATKMVNVLGIMGAKLNFYQNTGATGRLCIVR